MSITKEYVETGDWFSVCARFNGCAQTGQITHVVEVFGDILLHEVGDVMASNQQPAAIIYQSWYESGTIKTTELRGNIGRVRTYCEPNFQVEFIYLEPFLVYKKQSNEQSISQPGIKQS